MSVVGTKRKCHRRLATSALGGLTDIRCLLSCDRQSLRGEIFAGGECPIYDRAPRQVLPPTADCVELLSTMCGRFTQAYTWQEIRDIYDLTGAAQNLEPRYNIAPTQQIDVVYAPDNKRLLAKMRWGLIPPWWKKTAKETPSTFNARAETVAEKPFFRSAFNRQRCIIPASGFYEWINAGKGQPKQPYYITASDSSPLAFAGLWSRWRDIETDEDILSATIIVTNANETLRPIHDRMPIILEPDSFQPWLSGEAGTELLVPAAEEKLTSRPVSTRVNKTGDADDASLFASVGSA